MDVQAVHVGRGPEVLLVLGEGRHVTVVAQDTHVTCLEFLGGLEVAANAVVGVTAVL